MWMRCLEIKVVWMASDVSAFRGGVTNIIVEVEILALVSVRSSQTVFVEV